MGDCILQYIAVRQCDSHDVLGVDLQRADSLPRSSMLGLDGKLCDESIDAMWQEPGDHDKCVVLSKRCQVGHKARCCGGCTCKLAHTCINIQLCNYNFVHTQKHSRDSAVFMYNDLLKAPIPAEDMAAT